MDTVSEQLIPLGMAARYAGVTPEHLNLLARTGKLPARKIGRNWFTTRQWLDGYFSDRKKDSAETFASPGGAIELRRIEMQEKLELAKIQAQLEFRRIEMQEKLEIARRVPEAAEPPLPINIGVMNHAAGFATEIFKEELDKVARQAEAQIRELENEKQLMAEFFTRELDEIRTHLVSEQEQKQTLVAELQKKAGEVERSRVITELEMLRENFARNLVSVAAAPRAELIIVEPAGQETWESDWRIEPLHADGIYHVAKNLPMARRKMTRQIGAGVLAAGAIGVFGMFAAPRLDTLGTETLFVAEVGERMGAAMILTSRDLYERFAPSFAYHFADVSFLEPVREFYKPGIEQGLALYTQIIETPVDMSPFTDQAERVIASFKNTADRIGQVAGATTFHAMPWQGGASTTAPPN